MKKVKKKTRTVKIVINYLLKRAMRTQVDEIIAQGIAKGT